MSSGPLGLTSKRVQGRGHGGAADEGGRGRERTKKVELNSLSVTGKG